jgi:hypothetical protein
VEVVEAAMQQSLVEAAMALLETVRRCHHHRVRASPHRRDAHGGDKGAAIDTAANAARVEVAACDKA